MTNFPWFFIIGAQKSGTSTLHAWLKQSPEIALPWSKETHFFCDEKIFSRDTSWYLQQFKTTPSTKVMGEVDPEYMFSSKAMARIQNTLPQPKLVCLLREPLERAFSHYRMSCRWGYESLSFADALTKEDPRLQQGGDFSRTHHSYAARGCYARQIAYIRHQFPDAPLMLLRFEDLFSNQELAQSSLERLCLFLGVDHAHISMNLNERKNEASVPKFTWLRNFIYHPNGLKKAVGRCIPSERAKLKIMRTMDWFNTRSAGRENAIIKNVPQSVQACWLCDLQQLQQMNLIDVRPWIKKYEFS